MTSYTVAWGHKPNATSEQYTVFVSAPADMDAAVDRVLETINSMNRPQLIDIYPVRWEGLVPPGLQLGIGHHERAVVIFADFTGSVHAVDPELPELAEPLGFDYGGQWTEIGPDRTRVSPESAREAARQYVETGQRPTCVEWE